MDSRPVGAWQILVYTTVAFKKKDLCTWKSHIQFLCPFSFIVRSPHMAFCYGLSLTTPLCISTLFYSESHTHLSSFTCSYNHNNSLYNILVTCCIHVTSSLCWSPQHNTSRMVYCPYNSLFPSLIIISYPLGNFSSLRLACFNVVILLKVFILQYLIQPQANTFIINLYLLSLMINLL